MRSLGLRSWRAFQPRSSRNHGQQTIRAVDPGLLGFQTTFKTTKSWTSGDRSSAFGLRENSNENSDSSLIVSARVFLPFRVAFLQHIFLIFKSDGTLAQGRSALYRWVFVTSILPVTPLKFPICLKCSTRVAALPLPAHLPYLLGFRNEILQFPVIVATVGLFLVRRDIGGGQSSCGR